MYLDTVNYEHLAVSQEAFLRHLAAAGIPEAHLELRRMQEEAAGQGPQAGSAGDPAADYGTPDRQPQGATRQAQQGGEAAGTADVLVGLELASGGTTPVAASADGEHSGLGSAQHSMPATPVDAAVALFGHGRGSGKGNLEGGRSTSLTPLPGEQSPTVLALSGGVDVASAALSTAEPACHATEGERQHDSGMLPRGLSFQSASEMASVAEQQEQWRQQQRQAAEEQAATERAMAAGVAAAERQRYAEAALIEEMVTEGTRHVLAAEAAGQLQQRYPFMYAQAEDLSLVSWHAEAGSAGRLDLD